MKRVFFSEVQTGFKLSIYRWIFAMGAACLCLINIAAAQFAVDASTRKFLQYFMGGYLPIIFYHVYNGTAEKNVHIVLWAAFNALLNIVAVYVWHKDAKNDFATPDKKLTLACRITYVTQALGVASGVFGGHWRYFADQTLQEDASNVEVTQLALAFAIFFFMGAAAASQIDVEDQKKFVQYTMVAYLTGFVKLVQSGLEFQDHVYCSGLAVTVLLLQAQVFLTYGGSCLQTIIRFLYTGFFACAYTGFFNTPRFLKLWVGDVAMSNDAGLLIACLSTYIGLMFVATAQLEADAHRKVLQYYSVGNLLLFLVLQVTPSLTDVPIKWQIVLETVFVIGAIYQKELGLDNCKCLCPFAWGAYFDFDSAASGPSSPKRSANKGRSATPGGKSAAKKKK